MSRRSDKYDYMDLEDFEELLPDRPRDERWELIDGRVVKMMVGARWNHHLIIQNLVMGLRNRLAANSAGCRVFSETFFMRSKALDSAVLPDVMVRCGPIPPDATSFDDPVVLVEVMSPGSVTRDRVEKWNVYRRLASLEHYVLVDRDQPSIEVFDRAGEAWASRRILEGLDSVLDLPALGLALPLAEIYQDVIAP